MKKKLLVLLLAGLLIASATACSRGDKPEDTTTSTEANTDGYIVVGTDAKGNDITEPSTGNQTDPIHDPTEHNPTFVDVTKKVVVISSVAKVRTATTLEANNVVGWPSEGRELEVTGESANWYRISYTVEGTEKVCYIVKSVAADVAALEGFTAAEEEVEITENAVYVRSYPSTASEYSIRGILKKGDKVTRVAVSDKWSRILFELKSETETGADGKPKVETKQYYVSNDCLKVVSQETESTTTVDETAE